MLCCAVLCLVAQLFPTLWDTINCSLPCSSVHRYSTSKNIEVGFQALLQGISPTQRSNLGLPHCRWVLYPLRNKKAHEYWSRQPISLEKAIATYSSTLSWKIPWMKESGRLQSMGSLRVRQDWATSLSLFTFLHWRRKWQPTPVFLPGESQGQGRLVGCCLWGRTESDTTEAI